MKLIRKRNNKKYLFLFLTLISLTNPIFAGYGGEGTKDKAEKISKFRTQELINYVNLTIYYLYSAENRNERHVILFKSCQKLLNSNKKTGKGKDKKNLTSCTNLMKMGTYTNVSSNVNSKSIENSTKTKEEVRRKEDRTKKEVRKQKHKEKRS